MPGSVVAVLVVLHRGTGGQAARVLSRLAGRAVTEPEDGAALEVARVYLAPGDRHLIVRDGRIGIEHSERVRFSRPSIDVLFESVAKVYGPRAIGVLLSGYGSDGVAGLHTIRAQGGTTIVQDPSEARAPHLPRAAIAADGIDLTLPLREIGPAIGRLVPKAISSPSMPSDDIAAQ
jgi:two-component system chemotaxis response regulator CheB